jgi:SAM-dependent methyltransferase
MKPDDEIASVERRYARRVANDTRYSLLNPSALLPLQERQRAVLALFKRLGWTDLSTRRLLEVGCGSGGNLLDCLVMGFAPEHLAGIELLVDRFATARERLPARVGLRQGDASTLVIPPHGFDVVLQVTVFSSLLDDVFQQRLADAMWAAVKPGGGVLWYDFTYDNPRNPDVRGVPLSRVKALFPRGKVQARRITLAPPLNRLVTRVHPQLYAIFNTLPFLRTHLLCWIAKP